MSRGKGAIGCPMQTVSSTKKRKLTKWLAKSYEERAALRDQSSARRLKRLEAKGKIESLGPAPKVHTCGNPTRLEAKSFDASGRHGTYAMFCTTCGVFA